MNKCPCCSSQLLRHARHSGLYWFCPHCWQEMPDLSSMVIKSGQCVKQLERLMDISTLSTRKSEQLKTRGIA